MKNSYYEYNNKSLVALLREQGSNLSKDVISYHEVLWLVLAREDAKLALTWAEIMGTEIESMCDIILNSGNYVELDSFLSQFPEMHDKIYSFIINRPVDFYTFSWISHEPRDSRTIVLKQKVIAENMVEEYLNYLY